MACAPSLFQPCSTALRSTHLAAAGPWRTPTGRYVAPASPGTRHGREGPLGRHDGTRQHSAASGTRPATGPQLGHGRGAPAVARRCAARRRQARQRPGTTRSGGRQGGLPGRNHRPGGAKPTGHQSPAVQQPANTGPCPTDRPPGRAAPRAPKDYNQRGDGDRRRRAGPARSAPGRLRPRAGWPQIFQPALRAGRGGVLEGTCARRCRRATGSPALRTLSPHPGAHAGQL